MADAATISLTATLLPDEIAKTISATMTVTPADATEKWYYKLTSVSNASSDLIAGYFTDYTAVDDDTAPTAVATGAAVAATETTAATTVQKHLQQQQLQPLLTELAELKTNSVFANT